MKTSCTIVHMASRELTMHFLLSVFKKKADRASSSIYWFSPQESTIARAWRGQARVQELQLGLPRGCHVLNYIGIICLPRTLSWSWIELQLEAEAGLGPRHSNMDEGIRRGCLPHCITMLSQFRLQSQVVHFLKLSKLIPETICNFSGG